MSESTQHKLDRVRSPRVHITYDVEIGDAVEKKELPLVVGILSDLSGNPENPLPKIKDRKFVEIDRDNINEIMAASDTRLSFSVPNKLANDDTRIGVELKFKNMDDFNPINVLNQVEPLKKLYDARRRLTDLVSKLDGNTSLDDLLQDTIKDKAKLEEIKGLIQAKVDAANKDAETPEEPAK